MRIRLCRHRPSSSTAAEQLARWTNFSRACSVEPGVEQPAQSNGRQGFRFRVDGTCGTEPSGLLWVDLIVPETTFGTPKCIKTVQAVGPWIPFQMSSIYIYIYIYWESEWKWWEHIPVKTHVWVFYAVIPFFSSQESYEKSFNTR